LFSLGSDTPLPDLNIVVTDVDVGKNAEFDLVTIFLSSFFKIPNQGEHNLIGTCS
jgi:hypothetical protein